MRRAGRNTQRPGLTNKRSQARPVTTTSVASRRMASSCGCPRCGLRTSRGSNGAAMPAVWLACAVAILGHNPDTSYARIEIRKDQVETKLTYDIFTLLSVAPLDDNRDGQVSREELTRH